MSSYAIKLADGTTSTAATGQMADIAALTKIGVTLRVKGDRFTTQTDNVERLVIALAAGYLAVTAGYNGANGQVHLSVSGAVEPGPVYHQTAGHAQTGYDATRYYTIRAWWDTTQTTNKQGVEIYDDTGTLVDSGYASVATAISNGTWGAMQLGNGAGFVGNPGGQTTDWIALWDGMPPAGAPSEPTVGTAGLKRLYHCDENGGTVLTEAVDNTTGSATLTGTYSWVLVSSPADHGTVTLSPSTIPYNGTGTATVQWYDAANNPIPDPGTTWSVVNLGATINSTTGAYTGAGAGTATIRATAGAVHADALLTLTRRLTLTGTVNVA